MIQKRPITSTYSHYQNTRHTQPSQQAKSESTKKYRGHETFLLHPFFENLRFNIASIFKKEPVDLFELKTKYPKLYSTVQKVAAEYTTDEKTVITSFLNLKLAQKRELQQ